MTERSTRVLTINSGSSSLKAAVYQMDAAEARLLSLEVSRIGLPQSRVRIAEPQATVLDVQQGVPDHASALDTLLGWLDRERPALRPELVGHRVVHGGGRYSEPEIVTPAMLTTLDELIPVDPDHLPQAIAGIRAVGKLYPGVPQVACFDTGFHHTLPAVARRYALPRELGDDGVIRYGFHGLSYEYVVDELRSLEGAAAGGRVIAAHLGNGASMAAIRDGRSIDTTMGFSPTGGLVMGTRCGDLDPSVPLYLFRERGMSAEAMSTLINWRSGLLAVSETTEDMRDLLAVEAADPRAAEAVALFCYQAKKYLAGLAAALGGLDILVFTAGIGERAAPVRAQICADLEFLGIKLDAERNGRNAPVISSDGSRVTVRVIKANEELMVARHATRLATRQAARQPAHLAT